MAVMAASTQRRSERTTGSTSDRCPDITRCESCPEKSVFIESGNTDGWIASDLTVDVRR